MKKQCINLPKDYMKLKAAQATAYLDGQKTFEYQQDTPTGTRPVRCNTEQAGYLLEYIERTADKPKGSY
jgi:hypothetical protein